MFWEMDSTQVRPLHQIFLLWNVGFLCRYIWLSIDIGYIGKYKAIHFMFLRYSAKQELCLSASHIQLLRQVFSAESHCAGLIGKHRS